MTLPPRHMITFSLDGARFLYRVVGIIIHNEHVLCQRADRVSPPHWFLPGGRAELLEPAMTTLRREIEEELALTPTVERPLALIENFYSTPDRAIHEIGFYFLLSFPSDAYIYQRSSFVLRDGDSSQEGEADLLYFDWLPLADIEHAPLYPLVVCPLLRQLPETFQHIVYQEK
ncbi:NUDIX hydrolase [Ktedonospora formicarum]|uniref:DNA mismatch repair protein MutT n=1 Tax=Ktedonospora formicarum TaxID=2778364 RepID=A0A8J3MS41_9CHLR|nr:NUDIX domain-containing protein [Ktedonospora formicarum]GHO44218.1 DNA mismatch repair protein MutT [Ktedonospora formicarum]